MPHPVTIPSGAFPTNDARISEAEVLLQSILQLERNGSTGAVVQTDTPAVLVPQLNGAAPVPHEMSSAQEQVLLRNVALAVAHFVATHGSGGSAISFADEETPSGALDGANTIFLLAHTPNPIAGLRLYLNGVLLRRGIDYTISGNTITLAYAPSSSEWLLAWYRY